MPLARWGHFNPRCSVWCQWALSARAQTRKQSRQETQRRVMFGGRMEIATDEKAALPGIVLMLVLVLLWHNLIIRLSLKHSGYHNCLLNNSINLSELQPLAGL